MSNRPLTSGLALAATSALVVTALAAFGASPASAAVPAPGLTITGLGQARPGEAQFATVTLTGANGPVAGEDVTLSLDHGFFTDGEEDVDVADREEGDLAGNLVDDGRTITVTTEPDGTAEFAVGIARDAGFDDDGEVAAVVTATAGSLTEKATADWDAQNPLNGQVSLELSPAQIQENPVAPTVTSDRTYYEVVTADQFGNPVVDVPVDLLYPPDRPTFDYSSTSVVSDRTRFGDFWVESDAPGDFDVDATWLDAPTYTFDANGNAVSGTDDAVGSTTSSYYDIDFARTAAQMTSTAAGDQVVGTTVTQTVTVTDQLGRPVEGFDVTFYRFGPDAVSGGSQSAGVTNNRGQASYTFVGTLPGVAKVSAVVDDDIDSRTLASDIGFKYATSVQTLAGKVVLDKAASAKAIAKAVKKAKAAGKGEAAVKKAKKKAKKKIAQAKAADVIEVQGSSVATGAAVTVFRSVGSTLTPVASGVLGSLGATTVSVKDRSKKAPTTYVVVVSPTGTAFGATSTPLTLR